MSSCNQMPSLKSSKHAFRCDRIKPLEYLATLELCKFNYEMIKIRRTRNEE